MVWYVKGMILGLPTGPGGIPQLQANYQGYLKARSSIVIHMFIQVTHCFSLSMWPLRALDKGQV